MKRLLIYTAVVLSLSACAASDAPPEVQVAAACNSYGNAIVAAKPYRTLMSDKALIALKATNDSATRTCKAASEGTFADGAPVALFLVLEATNTVIAAVCALNPDDPTCEE